jgi:hypothetical protein
MTLIYVDQISPRIKYTFEFIFGSRGLTYDLTVDKLAKVDLSYSENITGLTAALPMAAFMLKDKIERLNVEIESNSEDSDYFSFNSVIDPIASIFYTLSRYEEYVCEKTDEFGRFPLAESNAPKEWLLKSKCDRWVEEILSLAGITDIPQDNKVQLIPSFDIDNSYAYKLKTGKRKWLSILKDLLGFNFKRIQERRAVLKGDKRDPYDTFSKIKSVYKRFPKTKVFWLIGKWGEKDRNISIQNSEHRKLIKSLSDEGIEVGLHPSFASFQKKEVIELEKKEIESVCEKDITLTRQHFLRFQASSTFTDLGSIGFKDEYSMGFAEHVGFRSGTARSHAWFDLSQNKPTELIIHPFAYMDGTLREYMSLSIEESKKIIRQLYDEVSRYGGDFIFIWHNETIGDYGNWNGWSEVLDFTLSLENESN